MLRSKLILKLIESQDGYDTKRVTVSTEDGGDLATVLETIESFLQAAGFTWVDGIHNTLEVVSVEQEKDEAQEEAHIRTIVDESIEGYSRDADGNLMYTGEEKN